MQSIILKKFHFFMDARVTAMCPGGQSLRPDGANAPIRVARPGYRA
jgi:hypothetical protein